jgi:hypothetical protein
VPATEPNPNKNKADFLRWCARKAIVFSAINGKASQFPEIKPPSAAVARYVALFNQRDWDGFP